jgi:hypothetical protein
MFYVINIWYIAMNQYADIMKTKILQFIVIACLATITTLKAQAPAIDWYYSAESTIGTSQEDWVYDIFETSTPDEYLFGGFTEVSSVYVPVVALCDENGLIWETQIADGGVIYDVLETRYGYVAIGNGPDPNNSDEPSILFAQLDFYGTLTSVKYINHYTLTSLSSDYTIEGSTIEPLMVGENLEGFVISATYDDAYGLRAGTVVMKLDVYGDPDLNFNSSTGFYAFHMHPGYNSLFPFSENAVYGRPYAIVDYDNTYPVGIIVAGTVANSMDDVTSVFVAKLEMDGDYVEECPDGNLNEGVLVSNASFYDNFTSSTLQCVDVGSSSFIDAGPYPFTNNNSNTKVADLLQSSYNGNIIVGLQLDYFFVYNVSCSFGTFSPPSYINADIALIELAESDLDLVSSKSLGRFTAIDYATPVIDDGSGYTMLGGTIDDGGIDTYMKVQLVKADYGLSGSWTADYFGDGDYINCPFGLGMTSDGGYIIGGNNDLNDEDYNFIKLEGPSPRLANPEANSNTIQVSASVENLISIAIPQDELKLTCNVYSADGRKLKAFEIPENVHDFSFSFEDLAAGIYMIEISNANEIMANEKVVLIK